MFYLRFLYKGGFATKRLFILCIAFTKRNKIMLFILFKCTRDMVEESTECRWREKDLLNFLGGKCGDGVMKDETVR